MTTNENMPWQWLLLGILEDSGGQATLQDIYLCIETQYHEIGTDDGRIIKSRLLAIDPKYGNRPIYQHTVRGCLSAYGRRGFVERAGEGIYRLTESGLERLESIRS